MSTLTRILLKRAFNKANGPESNQQERKEGKKEEKKLSILMFLYRRLQRQFLNGKKRLPRESYSLASRDGQGRVLPRAEVVSIVFINLGRYILAFTSYEEV